MGRQHRPRRRTAAHPFTEAEARELLAARGIVDEAVVRDVLRLSGRLPVLLTTLAANPATAAGAVDDPSATAVERFLDGERDHPAGTPPSTGRCPAGSTRTSSPPSSNRTPPNCSAGCAPCRSPTSAPG
ncbi:hypothetical protein ACFQ60_22705 [Streptomyces zhihengii]